MITTDADWVYFETEEESSHFSPIQDGDSYLSTLGVYKPFHRTIGGNFAGSNKRRRPRSNCTPEQLAMAGISNEPTYEHFL